MIVEYIRYNLPSGLNAQFEADYAKAAEFLKASSVCFGYDLTHCEEEPQRYILRILWTSTAEHLTVFRNSEEFKGFFASIFFNFDKASFSILQYFKKKGIS